jgi:PAS domain S-box-containing protein
MKPHWQVHGWRFASVFAGILLLGVLTWVVADWQVKSEDAALRQALLRQAEVMAQTINPEAVKTLAFTLDDRQNPEFLRLRQQMIGYGRVIRQRSLYSMALRDGTLIFGPENLAEDDPMASPPGTAYLQPSPQNFKVFQDGNSCVFGPITDEYGTFVTAVAPVLDPRSGKVLLAIGLDIPADEWLALLRASRHGPLLGGALLLLLLLCGVFAVMTRGWLADPWPHRLRHVETAWVGSLGLGLTLAAVLLVISVEERRQCSLAASDMVRDMQQICDAVLAVRNDLNVLARLHQGDMVEAGEFDAVTEPMLQDSGVHAVAWAPRESAATGDAYPIRRLTDFPGRTELLGHDLASLPGMRTIMERAAETGLNYGSPCFSGCPGVGVDEGLTLIAVKPVFFSEASTGTPDGFVAAIIQPQAYLYGLMHRLGHTGANLSWIEVSQAGEERILAAYPDMKRNEAINSGGKIGECKTELVYPVFAFGRAYALASHLAPSRGIPLRQGWLVGAIGMLLTSALTSLVGFLRNREAGWEDQVRTHSAALVGQIEFDSTLVDTIPSPVYYKDAAGRYLGCNRAFEVFHGTRREDLVGKTVHDIAPPEIAARYAAMDQELFAHPGRQMYEWKVRLANGTEKDVIFHKATFQDENGKVAGIVGVILDISERKRAEEERRDIERQLAHAQKFESLGIMAGGIAHDFNNLLTAVLGNIELVKKSAEAESPAARRLQSAHQAAKRAAELSAQMLAYSGRGGGTVHALDVNRLIEQHAPMLQSMVAKTVPVQIRPGAGIPEIQADPGQLRQLLINLVTNAVEAVGNKPDGAVEIATGMAEFTADELKRSRLPTRPSPGRFAWLAVQDNGCGMDEDTMHKLFDPFFTTKFMGRGLGMSAALGIVKEHRGAIFVESKPGEGTTFRILFPA